MGEGGGGGESNVGEGGGGGETNVGEGGDACGEGAIEGADEEQPTAVRKAALPWPATDGDETGAWRSAPPNSPSHGGEYYGDASGYDDCGRGAPATGYGGGGRGDARPGTACSPLKPVGAHSPGAPRPRSSAGIVRQLAEGRSAGGAHTAYAYTCLGQTHRGTARGAAQATA